MQITFQNVIYTLATILIIMGALFIIQTDAFGIYLLTGGIALNVMYRLLNLRDSECSKIGIRQLIRALNILILVASLISFYAGWDQKFNLLIIALIFDFVSNIKDLNKN